MNAGFGVVPETVRGEAKKWQGYSDAVEPVREPVQLPLSTFFAQPFKPPPGKMLIRP